MNDCGVAERSSLLGCYAVFGKAIPDVSLGRCPHPQCQSAQTQLFEPFKIKTVRSFETPGIAHPTTQRHIPKHVNSQLHRCENLRSSVKMLYIPITRTIIITHYCVFVILAALS